ncbi:Dihydroneopterin aldolase/2-amino-4-hydroxy-6- hydroxymethyldihydropteridine pyrophosphokinase [Bifidobacterium pullorum subsp. gallinarum]|uniref:2-amino-4-hydroxy-6-hydroxymethyldihydropteridine diphosphokinase n=1 Tax=Bifidobacterium pullorum subsp. gallinarum TaxID=78344 RepID=A0A087APK1_9BIFI|nr:Dihydroneopterin aldolase/2-amino-4-hydroxy-6- hydroxymethyldihydropteridine pyrophosphokinase [Bifidobacterium pullorum subsp. gallinarum]
MTDNREPARIGVTVQLTEEQTQAFAAGQAVDIVVRLVPDVSATCGGSPAGMGAAAMEPSSDDGTSYAHQESMWESSPTAGEVLPGAVSRRAVVSLDSTLPEAETLFRSAIVSLDAIPGNEIEGISPLYHVSNFDGPDAMAAVVQLHTRLDARSLIGALGTIEEAHADQIDLDLVDMEGVSSNEPDCRVPWPSAARRAQVLAPWFDMDPDARLGGDPVSFLLAMAPDAGRVGVLSDDWILGGER